MQKKTMGVGWPCPPVRNDIMTRVTCLLIRVVYLFTDGAFAFIIWGHAIRFCDVNIWHVFTIGFPLVQFLDGFIASDVGVISLNREIPIICVKCLNVLLISISNRSEHNVSKGSPLIQALSEQHESCARVTSLKKKKNFPRRNNSNKFRLCRSMYFSDEEACFRVGRGFFGR